MDLQDFQIHLRLALVRENMEQEFRVKLAGGSTGPSKPPSRDEMIRKGGGMKKYTKHQKFDPVTGTFRDV